MILFGCLYFVAIYIIYRIFKSKFNNNKYTSILCYQFSPNVYKALKYVQHDINLDADVSWISPHLIIPHTKGIKPVLSLSLPSISESHYNQEQTLMVHLAHEYGHFLSYSMIGIDKYLAARNNEALIIVEENNAWALGRQFLEMLFPNDSYLMLVFEQTYEDSMLTYFENHKKPLDYYLKKLYTKDIGDKNESKIL